MEKMRLESFEVERKGRPGEKENDEKLPDVLDNAMSGAAGELPLHLWYFRG
jgi:hypothetical protein